MLNVVDLEDAQLLEGQSGNTLGKLPVGRPDILTTNSSNLGGVHPLILKHLSSTNNGDARRVASLESRHQRKLLARGEEVLGVNRIGLLLGVVAIRRLGGAKDRSQEGASAENVADGVGDGEDGVVELEEGLEAGAHILRGV